MLAINLGTLLAQTAARLPDRAAIVWGDRRWSWAELESRVDALVAGLASLGLGKGDPILVQARNSNQMVEAMWACFRLGAVWVPVNFRLTPAEVAALAESVGAKAVIHDDIFAEHAAGIHVPHRIGIPQAYEALIEAHAGSRPGIADVGPDDHAWYFFTSGTTGRPKAAVLTHGQLNFCVVNHLADLTPGLHEDSAALAVAPLSHGAGMHMLMGTPRGCRTVLLAGERFDPAEAWRLVEAERIDNMFTVPTIVKMLVEHEAVDRHDHSSLRWIIYAGAPMYREDQKRALAKLGPVLVQYFGLGEVTGNITVLPPHLHSLDDAEMPLGSCGYARTGMELAIKDPEGRRLGPGEQGEICVRGLAVFSGYLNNPEANAKSLRDGWFHTGDLGTLDARGFLRITGRASDMYISGGSNVYPREAEEILLTHPSVSEVAILGVPDAKWGEAGVAVAVPAGPVTEAELLAYLEGRLARYKWPRRIFLWEELPKSGYGKVPKHLIRVELERRGLLTEGVEA